MKTLNKVFEYQNERFNIKVELDKETEKHINGNSFHLITVNDLGATQYYKTYKVTSHDLFNTLSNAENEIINYIDKRQKLTTEIKKLYSLGFQ